MTGEAGRVQPEVCEFFLFNGIVGNICRLVAIRAGFLRVCAFQAESREIVIKIFLVEPDDLKIHSVMIAMACYTGFTTDLCGGMVPFILVDS